MLDPRPLEDFSMWAIYRGAVEPDIRAMKELVHDWVTLCVQKTSGQRKDSKGIPWENGSKPISIENLERIKMGILCEAVALVLSGKLDSLESKTQEGPVKNGADSDDV